MAGKFDRFMVDVHIGTNRKLRRLTVPERWCHVAGVLALAAQAPIRGRLLVGNEAATIDDFAEVAGVPVRVAQSCVAKLRAADVIVPDEKHHCEMIHDWDSVNPGPRDDKTNAERQRRYRDRRDAALKLIEGEAGTVTTPPDPAVSNALLTRGREVEEKERVKTLSRSGTERADREREKATDDDRRLCRLLAELARDHNPKLKVKSDSAWLRDMRLLRDRDGNSPEEIERLIGWVFSEASHDGSFWWADVIQSPGNLRDHFAQMWAKMRSTSVRAVPDVESSTAYLARRGAE